MLMTDLPIQVTKHDWSDNSIPMVSVVCITYNHKPYIREAIESFLMQMTNFHIDVLIGEDYSTDGTRKIVFDYEKKYPDLIRVITSNTNVGIQANGIRTLTAARGKYIALCEGDDYWTDPNKLQKQVDFLEKNSDYGMVHTNHDICNSNGDILEYNKKSKENIPIGFVKDELLVKNFISTLTVCIRKDILDKAYGLFENKYLVGDYPLWMSVSLITKIGYINESTAVYRLLKASISNHGDYKKHFEFILSGFDIKNDLIRNYDFSDNAINNINIKYADTLLYFGILLNQKKIIAKRRKFLTLQRIPIKFRMKILSEIARISIFRYLLSLLFVFNWKRKKF